MVGSGIDGRDAVEARRQAIVEIHGDLSVRLGTVDALEECEDIRICRGRLVERGQLFDDDVRVANDCPLSVDLLGRGVIVGLRVDKRARLEIVECHVDCETRVRGNAVCVLRENEL